MPRGLTFFKGSPLSKKIIRHQKPEREPPYWSGKADACWWGSSPRTTADSSGRWKRLCYIRRSEEFRLIEVSEGTHITYKGQIECPTPFLPGVGWLLAFFYVHHKYGNVVNRHMEMLKKAAEAPGAGDMMNEGE